MISDISCSGGGPLIALPSEIAADWRGTLPPIGANVPDGWRWGDSPYIECDYDRACGNIDNSWTLYPDICELKEGKLYIYDSAFEGYANAEEIRAYDHVVVGNPGPGKYNVYHQNTNDKVGLLKFVRI